MHTLRPIRSILALLVVLVMATGCDGLDSGTDPNAPEDTETTVSFSTEQISLTEESSPVEIVVTLNNPAGREVSGEILFAAGVGDAEAADFNIPEDNRIGENAFLAAEFSFPASAEDGATQTITFDITDDVENEDQEDGVFVFQNLQNASTGQNGSITIAVGAVQLINYDFADEEIDPLTVETLSGNGWGVSSASQEPLSPFAQANAFGGNAPSNSWLITEPLNFNEFDGEVLTFSNAKNFDDGGVERGLKVLVSTNYNGTGDPTSDQFTWVDVSDQVTNYSEGGYNMVSSGEVDLSDSQFQGDAVYVAFQYISSGTGGGSSELWRVDNIVVTGQ
jgi:hypothetical protein